MTDEELLSYNNLGFIPGPNESEADFTQRVKSVKQAFLKLGDGTIPPSHWDWVEIQLKDLFSFTPHCLPAFYSNRSLTPWQGAAAWVEHGKIIAIQLRNAFKKGSFLGIYDRGEILSHEAVHAARSAFPKDRWDEYFAYMTSEKAWRRVLGPIVQSPWEVWPFLLFCIAGALFPLVFIGAAIWTGFGFYRLAQGHRILRKASESLSSEGYSDKQVRAILFRLTDAEIQRLSRGINIFVDTRDSCKDQGSSFPLSPIGVDKKVGIASPKKGKNWFSKTSKPTELGFCSSLSNTSNLRGRLLCLMKEIYGTKSDS